MVGTAIKESQHPFPQLILEILKWLPSYLANKQDSFV